MNRIIPALVSLLFFASNIYAQNNFKIYDINFGSAGSGPRYLTPYGTQLFFFANNGSRGWEPWTASAQNPAVMLFDMNPLSANALENTFAHPTITANNKVYFSADNGASGPEPFSYDGTTLPVIVQDINSGTAGSSPDNFVVVNNNIYFRANTDAEGYELYRYIPASGMLNRITDINAGSDSSITGNITVFGGNLYFTVEQATTGNELWKYDLIADTAYIVADINTGNDNSNPQNLTVYNGNLYFSAIDNMYGRELYSYDGTNPPSRITDLVRGFQSGMPDLSDPIIGGFGNSIFFNGRDSLTGEYHLYKYDPVLNTASLFFKSNTDGDSDPRWFSIYDNKLYFSSFDSAKGNEPWVYSGTGMPSLLSDICQGTNSSFPAEFVTVDGDLYFRATDCKTGIELFRYNPTLGVQEISSLNTNISAYPNPAADVVNIAFSAVAGQTLVTLTDASGRTVFNNNYTLNGTGAQTIKIPLNNLPTGIYICSLKNEIGYTYAHCTIIKE